MKKLGLLLMLFTFAACTNDDFSVLQENEEITLPTAVLGPLEINYMIY